MTGIRIVNTKVAANHKSFRNALEIALMMSHKYTLLPEIYSVFGRDGLLKFIDVFGGCTFTVPSQEDFMRTVMEVQIYLEMNNREKFDLKMKDIADRYGISVQSVLSIYKDMRSTVGALEGLTLDDIFIPNEESEETDNGRE